MSLSYEDLVQKTVNSFPTQEDKYQDQLDQLGAIRFHGGKRPKQREGFKIFRDCGHFVSAPTKIAERMISNKDKGDLVSWDEIIDKILNNEQFFIEMSHPAGDDREINIGMTSLKEVITNTSDELKFISDDKGNLCHTHIKKQKSDYLMSFSSDSHGVKFKDRKVSKKYLFWEWEYNLNGLSVFLNPDKIEMFPDYVSFPEDEQLHPHLSKYFSQMREHGHERDRT